MKNKPLTSLPKSDKDIDILKIKRRIKNWVDQHAHDEEIYEIATLYRIKTN